MTLVVVGASLVGLRAVETARRDGIAGSAACTPPETSRMPRTRCSTAN